MTLTSKSRRAISPILATLLILVLAVVASGVTLSWISISIDNTTHRAGVFLYNANVLFTADKITIDIGNSGISDALILAVYMGTSSSGMEDQLTAPALPINLASEAIVSLDLPCSWTPGVTYYFKIASDAGQQALEYQAKAP